MSDLSGLKHFAPEICSLICQDSNFERPDLNSICFISHTFRTEAQRILYYRFPCLRGTNHIKSWCLSLKRRPHIALYVQELVLLMPLPSSFHADDTARLVRALQMCVNLKELAVLPHRRRARLQDDASDISAYMLDSLPCTLTKFVNDYFSQNTSFTSFLQSQPMLQTLELHSREWYHFYGVPCHYLKTLSCPPQFPVGLIRVERLRLDFENSEERWGTNLTFGGGSLKSLAMFLTKNPKGKGEQRDLVEIMAFIARSVPQIKHLQIHQFIPVVEIDQPFSWTPRFPCIETLVFRPPPRLPGKSAGDPNLCAYTQLRTADGRRKAAETLMQNLQTLTRLVFVDYEYDYEFRRDPTSGIITGEELIILDDREWALVE